MDELTQKKWIRIISHSAGIILGLLFILSIISFDYKDSSIFTTATNSPVKNLIGTPGAYFSALLFLVFGKAAYLWIIAIVAIYFAVLTSQFQWISLKQIVSFILLIIIYAFFAAFYSKTGNMIESGGIIGGVITQLLIKYTGLLGFSLFAGFLFVLAFIGLINKDFSYFIELVQKLKQLWLSLKNSIQINKMAVPKNHKEPIFKKVKISKKLIQGMIENKRDPLYLLEHHLPNDNQNSPTQPTYTSKEHNPSYNDDIEAPKSSHRVSFKTQSPHFSNQEKNSQTRENNFSEQEINNLEDIIGQDTSYEKEDKTWEGENEKETTHDVNSYPKHNTLDEEWKQNSNNEYEAEIQDDVEQMDEGEFSALHSQSSEEYEDEYDEEELRELADRVAIEKGFIHLPKQNKSSVNQGFKIHFAEDEEASKGTIEVPKLHSNRLEKKINDKQQEDYHSSSWDQALECHDRTASKTVDDPVDNPYENLKKEDIPEEVRKLLFPDEITDTSLGFNALRRSEWVDPAIYDRETEITINKLQQTLKDFSIEASVVDISRGPVITRYELQPSPGIRLNKIVNLSDNIAYELAADKIRIEAPIPGKSAVGIEVPNKNRQTVIFGDILFDEEFQKYQYMNLPLVFGKDISGNIKIADLTLMPHLLIAGSTGSGKSVCVNTLLCSLLYSKNPEEVKFILVDPKIVELKIYNDIPHLLSPVITEPSKAAQALKWALGEMEDRYRLLDRYSSRNIKSYNKKVSYMKQMGLVCDEKLPYIVIIVDELADLMMVASKEVEESIARLAAMSRAVGIHLILATQRPSVDVITGLIKANFPSRIAFQVSSKMESRIILDSNGAEKLLGAGDLLFSGTGYNSAIRIQGAYLSEEEVMHITSYLRTKGKPDYVEDMFEEEDNLGDTYNPDEEPLWEEAVAVIRADRKASASYLQRKMKIGYNRAARIIEMMEAEGLVGPAQGSKPREVLVDNY